MGKTTGFTLHRALTHKTGILMKLNGQINYKYLLIIPLFAVIVFTIVFIFAGDFSYQISYFLLEFSASIAVMSSIMATSQTYIQLKQKESGKTMANHNFQIRTRTSLKYILIFITVNLILIGMFLFNHFPAYIALLLSILSLMIMVVFHKQDKNYLNTLDESSFKE
ncbi:MAG: hypothetical protein AMDU2_EPLC00006G0211 [Thermoplasmatales archaeon E-plasma]|jgi:hypothetical protein|nr:MAG: hypothetical protein AMDU2_EPLC00006G0211 [Thermoplasmatales archaeon E-plasma]